MKYTFERPYELVTLDRYPGLGNIIFSERHFEAGHKIAVHWHDYIEIEIVASGSVLHTMNNEKQLLTAGSAYIVSSCDFHGLEIPEESEIFNLSLGRGSLDEKLEEQLGHMKCRISDQDSVRSIFRKAVAEHSKPDEFSDLRLRSLAAELIIGLLRGSGTERPRSVPLVQKAIVEINDRFRYPLTLKQVAETLFVSPNYLGSIFSKSLGMSFNRYLAQTRLRFACGLLSSSDKPVKEIAFESGFGSVEYFLSTFRRYIGTTPSEWRGTK